MNLDTIIRVGETIYGNREHVHLYDMPPQVYCQKEMTIAGRTAIECVVDQDAIMLANDASQIIKSYFHPKTPIVIDLFTGSGNLLYHVTRSIGARYAIGFESSTAVYRLTQNNLWKLGFTAELIPSEFESSLHHNLVPENSLCLVIIDPPWSPCHYPNCLNLSKQITFLEVKVGEWS